MTKPAKLTAAIGASGIVCAVAAVAVGGLAGWGGLLAWTALACFAVAGAYAFNRPGVFGKRSDGRLSWWRAALLLPYLAAFWVVCLGIRRWRGLPAFDAVAPGLYVGGRVDATQLPDDVTLVVDLTCEYPETASVRRLPGYRCLPVLDGHHPPDDEAFLQLLDEMETAPGGVFVHCESGVGRAPTAAALLLMRRGVALDPAAAIERVRKGRPRAHPTRSDRAFMARVADRVLGARRDASRPARIRRSG